jgi:signal recognition particle receptor subunit beta
MYYRNANCAVVVYDITQAASLEKARSWIRELQRQADPSIIIALCGNKSDLSARRQVSEDEAKKYAEEEGLMWGETSAKSGEGVADIFTAIGITFCRPILLHLLMPKSQPRSSHSLLHHLLAAVYAQFLEPELELT